MAVIKKKDPVEYLRDNIRNLAPYSTARDEYDGPLGVYLDANESPYANGYNRYPDPRQRELKNKLSEIYRIPTANIFIGNGSDEPIDLVFRMFCEPGRDNAVSIAPTYGMYKVAAAINDIEMREVQLADGFGLESGAVLTETDARTKLIFLCSPNNPTGNCLERDVMEDIIRSFHGIVVLDEAYIDFTGTEGMLPALAEYPNLIILRTLSKAWGMAGLRLGLAFANDNIVEYMSRVKYPYNINVVTQQIVAGQLSRSVAPQIEEIISERGYVMETLAKMPVIKQVYPSDSNFVLVKVDRPREVYDLLIEHGVIVRDRSKIKGCEGCLRITIGTPEENKKMLSILNDIQE